MIYKSLVKPLLFSMDAEMAHEEIIGLMSLLTPIPGSQYLVSALTGGATKTIEKVVFGLTFKNPVGLAAGFDKDGKLVPLLPALGFGFLEIGSVTLYPQPGNPKPRLFRVPQSNALINRMGFNSEGARQVANRLAQISKPSVPLGINLGLNKGVEATKAPADYAECFNILSSYGDYFVINVSSPNTPGLRDLQKVKDLAAILEEIQHVNREHKPILVKLSPDMADADFENAVVTSEKLAQGFVISNTTISRDNIDQSWAGQNGGLSGAPLKDRALTALRQARNLTKLPLIGVGGIETAKDAQSRLEAGADLVQLYTAMVYHGPSVIKKIVNDLAQKT